MRITIKKRRGYLYVVTHDDKIENLWGDFLGVCFQFPDDFDPVLRRIRRVTHGTWTSYGGGDMPMFFEIDREKAELHSYRHPDKDGNPTLVATLPVGDFEKLIRAWQREFGIAKGKKDGEVWDMAVDFE